MTFEQKVEGLRNYLFIVIKNYTKNHEKAEDLLSETCLKLCRYYSRGKYDPSKNFKSWATTVAVNVCIDSLRKERSKKHTINSIMTDSMFEQFLTIENNIDLKALDLVISLEQGLTQDERVLFRQRFLDNETIAELAEEYKVSSTIISKKLNNLQNKLQTLIYDSAT